MNVPQGPAQSDEFIPDGEYIDPYTGVALSYRYVTAHMAHHVASKIKDDFLYSVVLIVLCVRVDGNEITAEEVFKIEASQFLKLLNLIHRKRN